MTDPKTSIRSRRSDGQQTYAAILETAVRLASVEGLGGLTIGRLAQEVGVSKSGLYAHFGSKRQLQADILQAARDIFDREVIEPGLDAPEGVARLEHLLDAYVSYVERRVFPGGCFFAGMMAEFDAQTGATHDEVAADQQDWVGLLESLADEAQARGDLDPDADLGQLVFEVTAAVELANYHYVLFGKPGVLDRARTAVRSAIARARPPTADARDRG